MKKSAQKLLVSVEEMKADRASADRPIDIDLIATGQLCFFSSMNLRTGSVGRGFEGQRSL